MPSHPRPIVVISRCIDFDSCRYNGQVIRASLREQLEPHVELRPICPELEIGLGVPRDPVEVVRTAAEPRMVQPATGRDLTAAMNEFSDHYLAAAGEVDGFILKSRSPSCGVRDGKGFRGPGLFAARALERFPHAAIEDEVGLADPRRREDFLSRVRALALQRSA